MWASRTFPTPRTARSRAWTITWQWGRARWETSRRRPKTGSGKPGLLAGTLLSEVERQAAAHAHQGRALLHPPKGDKTRSVRLTGHAVEALKDHRKRQLKQRLAAGPLWRENDLVFASTVGTPFDVGNFDLPLFQAAPAARRAPQDKVSRLRHTSATIFLSKGTHLKIVQKMLEHAT